MTVNVFKMCRDCGGNGWPNGNGFRADNAACATCKGDGQIMNTFNTFTDSEISTLDNCLMVAAERFKDDAKVMREAGQTGLAEQFDRQADEANKLREKVAEAL